MKAFVITIKDHEYSESQADQCIGTGEDIGKIHVERFYGVNKNEAYSIMKLRGLEWTWADNNTQPSRCPITNLRHHPYYGANTIPNFSALVGCTMSHYSLYLRCVELNEPILILEHDAIFVREFPEFDFKGICQINNPKGGGKNGKRLSELLIKTGKVGVSPKTPNIGSTKDFPDGLAGNSAYVIKPFAAQELINKYHEIGVWPNDAIMCIQLFPYLEEYYPFITNVDQAISTTTS